MSKLKLITVLIAILLIPATSSFGATPIIEGEVELSRVNLSQCLADVKEVTGWDEQETMTAARQVCKVRQQYVKQKQQFVKALEKLQQHYKDYTNHGFNKHVPIATADSWTIVKSCINLKEGFTAPHNVGTLTNPAYIHTRCYQLGTELIQSELQR